MHRTPPGTPPDPDRSAIRNRPSTCRGRPYPTRRRPRLRRTRRGRCHRRRQRVRQRLEDDRRHRRPRLRPGQGHPVVNPGLLPEPVRADHPLAGLGPLDAQEIPQPLAQALIHLDPVGSLSALQASSGSHSHPHYHPHPVKVGNAHCSKSFGPPGTNPPPAGFSQGENPE